ncbi:hypothetical protein BH09ACT4_BH09ACT4_09140 [soil metagenome]
MAVDEQIDLLGKQALQVGLEAIFLQAGVDAKVVL